MPPKPLDYSGRAAFYITCLMPFLLIGRATADVGMSLLALHGLVCLCYTRFIWRKEYPDALMALLLAVFVFLLSLWHLPQAPTAKTGLLWMRFALAYVGLRIWVLADMQRVRIVMRCVALTLALLLLDTYWQYITGLSLSRHPLLGNRLSGPLTHANIGNLLLKLMFPAVTMLAVVAWEKGGRSTILRALALGLMIIFLIPLTGERSITILMLVGVSAFGMLLLWKLPMWRMRTLVALSGVGAVLAVLFYTQPIMQQRGSELMQQTHSFGGTVYGQLFKGGWMLFTQHPLTGIGVGQYLSACMPLKQAGQLTYCDIHAHNFYLGFLSETGIGGGFLFMALLIVCMRLWWRGRPAKAAVKSALFFAGSGAALAVLFFPIVVMQGIFSNWPASLFWFSLALAMSLTERRFHD